MLHRITSHVLGWMLGATLVACGNQETEAQKISPEQHVPSPALPGDQARMPEHAQMLAAGHATPTHETPKIVMHGGWVRAGRPAGSMTAGYVTLMNHTNQTDRLTGLSTPVATDLEVHQMVAENGVMKMRPKTDISIAPGQSLTLVPGGDHLMFINLTEDIKEGDIVPITLEFDHAGVVTFNLPAQQSVPR